MRQTAEHRSYVRSRAVLSRHGLSPTCRSKIHRSGFTLIEVVVAMSILVVVVLALVSNYAFYYRSITNLRIQSIGANLAQLQLEDACNMGIASFKAVLGGKWNMSSPGSPVGAWPVRFPQLYEWPNYPPAELFTVSGASPVWYSYPRENPSAPIAGPSNLPSSWSNASGSIPSGPQTGGTLPSTDVLASITYNASGVPIEYDSGILDADFVVENLSSVPSGYVLPDSITLTPSSAPYTLDISKWTYPYYKRRITITDMSPNQSELSKKLYRVAVTVSWNGNGTTSRSVTLEQEVGFEGQT